MIKDYEIRKENGEETLFIYLDFDSEFAKLKGNSKRKKISQLVGDYLKEKNIDFSGKKIAIISGGLLMATLLMKAPSIDYNANTKYYEGNKIVLVEDNLDGEVIIDDLEQSTTQSDSEKGNVSSTKPSSSNQSGGNTISTSNPSQSVKPGPGGTNQSAGAKPESKPESPQPGQKPVDNATYITLKRSNGQILKIEIEEYLVGVVGAEMPASFNKEALKAQAIIARTYALRASERGSILTDNSGTQNYKSNEQLRAMWGSSYQTYYQKVKSAVQETKGLYLTYNGVIIDAVYHSTSNGQTENAEFVWGNAFPYLTSVLSPYDTSNSSYSKSVTLGYEVISSKLGMSVDSTSDIQILSKTTGMRVDKILIDGVEFTGVNIRNKLGLRSADFDIVKSDVGLTFTTRGYGHGVGLSQYGANGMANHGYDYASILRHYYRGITFAHLA